MRHPQASEVVNKDIISHFVLRLVYCRTNFPFAYLIGIDLHIVFMHVRCILENLILLDSCCEKPVFLF
ncbi:hypothetical protein FF1_045876 [Malus domestica]